jgi:ribosomal protein L37AE/L43A
MRSVNWQRVLFYNIAIGFGVLALIAAWREMTKVEQDWRPLTHAPAHRECPICHDMAEETEYPHLWKCECGIVFDDRSPPKLPPQ